MALNLSNMRQFLINLKAKLGFTATDINFAKDNTTTQTVNLLDKTTINTNTNAFTLNQPTINGGGVANNLYTTDNSNIGALSDNHYFNTVYSSYLDTSAINIVSSLHNISDTGTGWHITPQLDGDLLLNKGEDATLVLKATASTAAVNNANALNILGQLYAGHTTKILNTKFPNVVRGQTQMNVDNTTAFTLSNYNIYLGNTKEAGGGVSGGTNYLRMSHSHTYLNGNKILSLTAPGGSVNIGYHKGIEAYSPDSPDYSSCAKQVLLAAYNNDHFTKLRLNGDCITAVTQYVCLDLDSTFDVRSKTVSMQFSTTCNITHYDNSKGETGCSSISLSDDSVYLKTNKNYLKLNGDNTRLATNRFKIYKTERHYFDRLAFYFDTNIYTLAISHGIFNTTPRGSYYTNLFSSKSSAIIGDDMFTAGQYNISVGGGRNVDRTVRNAPFVTISYTSSSYDSINKIATLSISAADLTTLSNVYGDCVFYIQNSGYSTYYKAQISGNNLLVYSIYTWATIQGNTGSFIVPLVWESYIMGNFNAHFGYNLITKTDFQTVVGKNNALNNTALFIVGNGASSTSRSNAFVVDVNGNVTINGTLNNIDITNLESRVADIESKLNTLNNQF